MPKWGLTPEQRRSRPWGLSEEDLSPSKTITDPIHGDIYINRLEKRFLDSAPLQRLRRVRQLGTTYLVYPGASHTRLSHALGALRAAQDLLDAVIEQQHGPHPAPDLFSQWSADRGSFDRKVAEATVLARLGALLHDMCHVPFGHSVEDDIGLLQPHDANNERFEKLWEQLDERARDIPNALKQALRPLILSKGTHVKEELDELVEKNYTFVQDIVGNTICADLLDYLRRDHLFTGLPAQLGHRFIEGFYVTRNDVPYFSARMVVRIGRDGRERSDVVSELFKFLRYRYELSERALVHHAKLAADAMIGKLLEMWSDAIWVEAAAEKHKKFISTAKDLQDLDGLKNRLSAHGLDAGIAEIDHITKQRLEREFLRYSDDGLLEHILDQVEPSVGTDGRKAAIGSLVRDIQNRKLYKLIGRCSSPGTKARADEIHATFGGPEERRRLEQDIARFAVLEHRWHVVLWIPSPSMRLKAAEVLVDASGDIASLKDMEHVGQHRGGEIYAAHEALWGISVYAHEAVRREGKHHVMLGRLSAKLGVTWDDPTVPTLAELAVRRVGAEDKLTRAEEDKLLASVESGVPARGAGGEAEDFEAFVGKVRAAALALRVGKPRQLDLPK